MDGDGDEGPGDDSATVAAAMVLVERSMRLFADGGPVKPGKYYRTTGALGIALGLEPDGSGRMGILPAGAVRADEPVPPATPRLLHISWPARGADGRLTDDAKIHSFQRGEWEAEILAATEGPATR